MPLIQSSELKTLCELARFVQTRAEAAEKEVAHVKEKAWKMMAEKDAQLEAAKVSA